MILVTGGTGLVGTHLLLQLVQEGTEVRATFREHHTLDRVKRVFSYYSNEAEKLFKQIYWVQADINNLMALDSAFEQVTLVYHCAALISFDLRYFSHLMKINAEGTANIVNLCLAHGVKKLCYVSSTATVASPVNGKMATEEDFGPDRYPNVYAISKQSAEMEVWRGSQEGLPVVIVNPGIILGPGFWDSGSGVVFEMGAKGRSLAPPGGTGFVGVMDVARIMVRLMRSTLQNERFIVINKNLGYKEFLTLIGNEFKRPAPQFTLPVWLLQLLWRLDWLRCLVFGGRRKLTKSSVISLKYPVLYDNFKVINAINYHFEPLSATIEFCCRRFKEDKPGLVN